jgi:ABC-type antimicrobial peptide transport system permease subunit
MAARVGMPPQVVHGAALAYHDPSSNRPIRSTVTLGLAVLLAAGATTFAASLGRLGATPARWGSPWDLALDFTSNDVGPASRHLTADRGLSAVGRWDSGAALVDGEYVRASGLDRLRGDLGFSLVSGRQPSAGEVVIGSETAKRGGLEIGDHVVVASPESGRHGKLRVVGIALFPEVDDGDLIDGVGMTAEDFATYASVPDEFEASQVVVRVAPGQSVHAAEDRLRARYGGALDEPHPVKPAVVANLLDVRSIPRTLLAFAALLGLASLAHTVRSTTERHATDFATLRAIGMTRWQRWQCSLAQAIALAAVALLIGVPLGLAAGRATWEAVARAIDIVPSPVVPVVALTIVVAGSLLIATIASAVGRAALGRRALLVEAD